MSTSIIESKNYVPWVLRQSRDFQSFCKLFDLLVNNFKTSADYWTSLIDFDSCPDRLLPLLASYVGYNYDYTESYDSNRTIIKHFPNMIRNRGSLLGMSIATALSVNTLGTADKIEALNMFRIESVTEGNKIKIYIFFPSKLNKIRDLLELTRPAGCGLELVAADLIATVDGIEISVFTTGTKFAYDMTRYTVDETSRVGFSEITNLSRA